MKFSNKISKSYNLSYSVTLDKFQSLSSSLLLWEHDTSINITTFTAKNVLQVLHFFPPTLPLSQYLDISPAIVTASFYIFSHSI